MGGLVVLGLVIAGCAGDSEPPASDSGNGGTQGGTNSGVGGSTAATGGTDAGTGGTGGTAPGTGGTTSGTGGTTNTPTCIQVNSTVLLDFDSYTGGELSFLVAGEDVGGVYAGPWELNDEGDDPPDPNPTYITEVVAGEMAESEALRVADDEAHLWGGGVGFWMSGCVDAATYSGIHLRMRGSTPTGMLRLELSTRDTTPPTENDTGVCVDGTCQPAATEFALASATADEWVSIDLPWDSFTGGTGSNDLPVSISGFGITGFVLATNVQYDELGEPIPGPYELVFDEIGFY